MALRVFILFLAIVLQGCPLGWRRLSINEVIQPADVEFIVPGQTTLHEVVRRLGAPDGITATGAGGLVRYQFLDVKYFKLNLTRPLPYIFPVLAPVPSDLYEMTISAGGIGTDELQIRFDERWRVRHYAFAHHARASRYISR